MTRNLIVRLWADECGAVLSTEYLLLGTVVSVGGVSGMTAMRDSMTDEFKEFGQSVREVRQSYTRQPQAGSGAKVGGSATTNAPAVITFSAPGTSGYGVEPAASTTPLTVAGNVTP